MSAKLIKVPFAGTECELVTPEPDLPHGGAVLRRLCETIGVDFASQIKRLRRTAEQGVRWATVVMTTTVAEDGKQREMAVISIRSIPMWAATVDPWRVRPDVRPILAAYQDEAAEYLADVLGIAPRAPAAPPIDAVTRDELEAELSGVREQLDALRVSHEAAVADIRPTIGAGAARHRILDPLRSIARLRARALGDPEAFTRIRGELETRLRAAIGFPALTGARWANLPRVRLGDAVLAIDRMHGDARRLARAPRAQTAMRLQ